MMLAEHFIVFLQQVKKIQYYRSIQKARFCNYMHTKKHNHVLHS